LLNIVGSSEVKLKAEKEKRDLAAQLHHTAVERLRKLQGSLPI